MARATNAGREFMVWNFSVGTGGSTIILNNKSVNSLLIQARTGADIYLRRRAGDAAYYTIKSGTSLTLDIGISTLEPMHLTSSSGTVVVEIIGHIE